MSEKQDTADDTQPKTSTTKKPASSAKQKALQKAIDRWGENRIFALNRDKKPEKY